MGLFSKKPAPAVETSYDDVVGYLRDLAQPDYTKILKVVSAYRDADKKVKRILNIKDDSADEADFTDLLLEDEPKPKPPKKVEVK